MDIIIRARNELPIGNIQRLLISMYTMIPPRSCGILRHRDPSS